MKITFLAPALNKSGGVKVLLIHASELARLGHDVTIVSAPNPSLATVDRLRALWQGHGWIRLDKVNAPQNVSHIQTEHAISDQDVPDGDVVIATWWETAERVAALSPCKGRKFYFIQGHETFPPIPARSRETYNLPLKKIVVSQWLAEIMASEYGDSDVEVVPNSVDRMAYYAQPRHKQPHPTVGLLYSTAWPKGLDTSLRALEIVKNKLPELRVRSFGLHGTSRAMPLPSGSRFTRSPSLSKMQNIYRSCDVWITSSRSEGFNLTALEAMASRTPVVSTMVGWPADGIVDGVNGFRCRVDQETEIAEAALRVLSLDDTSWELMSEAAYRTMTTASWKESTALFEQAISR